MEPRTRLILALLLVPAGILLAVLAKVITVTWIGIGIFVLGLMFFISWLGSVMKQNG